MIKALIYVYYVCYNSKNNLVLQKIAKNLVKIKF